MEKPLVCHVHEQAMGVNPILHKFISYTSFYSVNNPSSTTSFTRLYQPNPKQMHEMFSNKNPFKKNYSNLHVLAVACFLQPPQKMGSKKHAKGFFFGRLAVQLHVTTCCFHLVGWDRCGDQLGEVLALKKMKQFKRFH